MNLHETLITGGSSGICKTVARQLLQRRLAVTLVARKADKLDKSVLELKPSAG